MPFTYEYPRPMITVDCVIFSMDNNNFEILLIQRDKYPFEGQWALPGGFVEMDEDLESAAKRELKEETGLMNINLEQLHTFGKPGRDPRGRTISVVYCGITQPGNKKIKAGDDARKAQWFPESNLPDLSFDHNDILKMALEKIHNNHNK